jgi:hypothetical protein
MALFEEPSAADISRILGPNFVVQTVEAAIGTQGEQQPDSLGRMQRVAPELPCPCQQTLSTALISQHRRHNMLRLRALLTSTALLPLTTTNLVQLCRPLPATPVGA